MTFNAGNTEARRKLLAGFWDVRAALGGVTVQDRIAEHFQRLAYVEQNYRRRSTMGAPPPNAFLWLLAKDRSSYDDRGVIYLRHGAPTQYIRGVSGYDHPNNESWYYRLPDGRGRMFHFIQIQSDYVLPYRMPCGDLEFIRDRATYDAKLGSLGATGRCSQFAMESYSADMREV